MNGSNMGRNEVTVLAKEMGGNDSCAHASALEYARKNRDTGLRG